MGVEAIYCAREFYTMEALKLVVETNFDFGKKSHEKLLNDIMEFRKRYINKLKQAFYDYTAMASFGEMRHGVYRSTHYNDSIPHRVGRSSAYTSAIQYNPTSILLAGKDLFGKEWDSGYGGEKWKIICERVLLKDIIQDDIFCDMCFSLSHNCSPYLNKSESGIFYIDNTSDYVHLLDYKFSSKDPKKLIRDLAIYVGNELRALLKRAMVLGFLTTHWTTRHRIEKKELIEIYGNRAERFILNYGGVEWGGTWIPTASIKHRNSICDYTFALFPEHISSSHQVKKGDILEIKYDKVDGFEKIKKGMIAEVVYTSPFSSSFEVVFQEDVGGHDLDGKCKDGCGLRLYYRNFKKHIA